jgi:hypothetical protein
MLSGWRARGVCRFATVLVVCALSGAPSLVEGHLGESGHRCHCHHGPGEVCTCGACARAAAKARRADVEKLPPCHRAAALAALEREQRGPPRTATMTGCCGAPEGLKSGLVTRDPCLPPTAPVQPAPGRDGQPVEASASAREVPLVPATPPPRVA